MSATVPGSLILIGPPGAGCSCVAQAIGGAQGLTVLDLGRLVADELGIARPAPTGVQTPTGRRMRNARLRAAGVELRYPTYREGYREMLRAEG